MFATIGEAKAQSCDNAWFQQLTFLLDLKMVLV
jgi:hypothetical protein